MTVPLSNSPAVRVGRYNPAVMTPAKQPSAGERLRALLKASNLEPAEASKLAGYPYRSGLQHHLESQQAHFHPKVIEKLARLVGKGNPPIAEAQVQALAINLSQLSPGIGSSPQVRVTHEVATDVLSSTRSGGAESKNREDAVEANMIHRLIEDVAILKSQVRELKARVAKREERGSPARPRKAGQRR